jgi:predicted LPLAT superfamily acyltransferase
LENKVFLFQKLFHFGKVLIDKTAISAGLDKYTYEFDGIENLRNLLAKKGGVLISAHIGNFEIAEHFLPILILTVRSIW